MTLYNSIASFHFLISFFSIFIIIILFFALRNRKYNEFRQQRAFRVFAALPSCAPIEEIRKYIESQELKNRKRK